jgi:radical SAM-linked protein
MRIRITFAKTDHMRYTSHLDVHRTWERTLRRARLPLSYSQGFNPRPKINLAAALPLGFTSDCEIVEFWLDHEISLKQVETQLKEAAPPGIEIQTIEEIENKTPKIPNLVDSADYVVTCLDDIPDLPNRVSEILAAETLPRERRNKPYDLRPLIEGLRAVTSTEGQNIIEMCLASRTGATGRPEEALLALGIDPFTTRVHRTKLHLKT